MKLLHKIIKILMVESNHKNTDFLLLLNKHISAIHANSYKNLEQGQVIKIIDGDGLLINLDEKMLNIRLAYIDAPEYNQEYGLNSKNWLENLFLNTSSVVNFRIIDFDEKHKRTIADVFINGYSLSWLMVVTGNAWAYYDFLTDEIEPCYLEAQYFARKYRLGLWTNNLFSTPPWIYRAEEKGAKISLPIEPNHTIIALLESGLEKNENIKEETIARTNQSQHNYTYCPMRYYEQVYIDQIKYADIMFSGVNWDIKTGYNGLEGDEVNIPFFQLAFKASQGDDEAAYNFESWKRGLYKAIGKVHLPGDFEKRLTQEWVDAFIIRVENWINETCM
jgi:endonuclease YncB( thermonuclease family)